MIFKNYLKMKRDNCVSKWKYIVFSILHIKTIQFKFPIKRVVLRIYENEDLCPDFTRHLILNA